MEHDNFSIEFEGEEIEELYWDLISLEVELDDDLAGMFRLQLAMLQQPEGLWSYLDDERLRAWKQVTVTAGFESGSDEVISGYITHIKPYFDSDPSKCILEIWGMDGSVIMDREEKLKDWPNKKDSDIAAEIFSQYGFSANVEDTEVIHDEAVSTIIQRETDIRFLKRLAARNGFECFVESNTGYFRKPQLDDPPQPLLAVHFGAETNVNGLSMELNSLSPANIVMFQVDRVNKEEIESRAETSHQEILGDTVVNDLLAAGTNPGQIYISMNAATGIPEMTTICQGLYHSNEWFLTAEGEIQANQYGHVLTPRKKVTIKGIGETYSGVYYVSHVTHTFTADGYTQRFQAKRNAIMPKGMEDFSESSSTFGRLS
jgi:phage protein D